MKSQENTNMNGIHPLGTMHVCTKCQNNPSGIDEANYDTKMYLCTKGLHEFTSVDTWEWYNHSALLKSNMQGLLRRALSDGTTCSLNFLKDRPLMFLTINPPFTSAEGHFL